MSRLRCRSVASLLLIAMVALGGMWFTGGEAQAACHFESRWVQGSEKQQVGSRVRIIATREKRQVEVCGSSTTDRVPGAADKMTPSEYQALAAKVDAEKRAWETKASAYDQCIRKDTLLSVASCGAPPGAFTAPVMDAYGMKMLPATPPITPQMAAYMAVAELTLTPPKPGIGPPPSINKWKMAAVGYPLWLWADGDTNPAPATDEVAGMTVSLDARVDKVVFQMGDGQAVTCQGTGTPWRRGAVTPGTPSATCGYRYQKPSLPRGTYTVTTKTYWAVDWEINGETGTIPIIQQASVQLPVGELQVTVR